MIPTLLVGDYLFVSKYSYGYSRYSLPFGQPPVPGRIMFTEPARGDVAVFKKPSDNSTDYIKRIIGLPGDRIQVVKGVLHINGEPVQRRPIGNYIGSDVPRGLNGQGVARYLETLPNGRSHVIVEVSGDSGSLDNTDEYRVPAGHYFAMGDNRDNSLDSRVLDGVGFVPRENLVGRAEMIFFSHNGTAALWEIWKWPSAIRFGRLFTSIP
jgi:signal peptidase I